LIDEFRKRFCITLVDSKLTKQCAAAVTINPNPHGRRGIFDAPPAAISGRNRKQKTEMYLDKQECSESISLVLERSSSWRKTISVSFDDPRNLEASETLDLLAIEAANLTDEQWTALQPHFAHGWSSQVWREALSTAARMVGFGHKSKSFDAFVRLVLRQLPSASIAA
jgi:hypothetical protein